MGLDFAFVWGFINFLLNYIPTLGAIIGVIPVSAFALVEFGIGIKALLVLLGISGIQIVMGIYLDPLLQGRQLSLSPLVVLFSVTFWGWLWGVPGAFIAIPITIALVIACEQYERTRWISVLLADSRYKTEEANEENVGQPDVSCSRVSLCWRRKRASGLGLTQHKSDRTTG